MMPISLSITLSLIIILSLLNKDQLQYKKDWLILGILLGLGILLDGKFLFVSLFLSILLFVKKQQPKKILTAILGILIILSLNGVRNKTTSGEWIFLSTQSGLSFYSGNNPDASGIYEHLKFLRPNHTGQDADQKIIPEMILDKQLSDKEVSVFWKQKGVDFIKNNPARFTKLLGKKFILFFRDTERAYDLDLILQRNWKKYLDLKPIFSFMSACLIRDVLGL